MIKNIMLNSGSNVAILLVKMCLTFIMAPILISNLGNYDYGLWEIFGAVIGYMGMLDLGIRPAISKYSAQYQADNDNKSQQLLMTTATVFMILIGCLLAIIFCIWGIYFPETLSENNENTIRYTYLCLILACQFIFVFPGYVAESILEAKRKYYIKNLFTFINSILGSSAIFVLITPENGLVLLASINAIGLSTKYLLYFIILRSSSNGKMKPFAVKPSMVQLKELILFGSKSLVQGISGRIESATDSLVIGAFLGPAHVPFYSIPSNLVAYIRTLSHTLTHVFMPLFSEMNQKKDARIAEVFLTVSKLVISLVLMISTGVVLLGAAFISLWIGPEYAEDAKTIIALLVVFIVTPLLNPLGSRYLTAINKHSIYAKLGPISAFINLGLSLVFVQYWGIIGVAMGSVIPMIIFTPIYLRVCCKNLNIEMNTYIRKCIFPSIIPLSLMFITIYFLKLEFSINSFSILLFTALLGSITYLISYVLLSISNEEKQIFKKIFKK